MAELSEIAGPFVEMAHRIVWCVAGTVSAQGEPRTRVLHPIWEWDGTDLTGWIATSPNSPKAKHLMANPRLSLTYWSPNHDTCTADCDTSWDATPELRQAGWDRFLHGPAPVGYDPSIIPGWTAPTVEDFGVLRLRPHRLRVMEGSFMMRGEGVMLAWPAQAPPA
jgi:hypothetical protein